MSKMEKKTLVSFGAKFRTFSIFSVEMAPKTIFRFPEFKFVVEIEVARFYGALDAILRLFLTNMKNGDGDGI